MRHEMRRPTITVADGEGSDGGSFEQYMEHVPAAFAVTRGRDHRLVYANAAFRRLAAAGGDATLGSPIAGAFGGRDASALVAALDRAFRTGVTVRDRRVEIANRDGPAWHCTVWPQTTRLGDAEHLVIELRRATRAEHTIALQRDVAERMMVSALRETAIASDAEAASRRATFLAAEGRRLAESLDRGATLNAVVKMSLPNRGAWCIVDVLDADGAMRRLAIVHPDPEKQALLRRLEGRWSPEPGDPFGAPAAMRSAQPLIIDHDIDAALAIAAHDSSTLRTFREVGVGPLLTVPMVVRGQLVGALTFVSAPYERGFAREDVELAADLAIRCAMALDSAHLHAEAIALRTEAESASQAKSAFLGTMSHELRTPLNAIGGYVDLIDMGLRGPVTAAQHADLARIRSNQRHLIGLVTDVLNFVRVGGGHLVYADADLVAQEVVAASVALVEPLMLQKQLRYDGTACDPAIVARGDAEKVTQILVNLFSNAIKFTPPGGRIAAACEATERTVLVRIADTGIGIAADKLESIFDPFVQIRAGLAGRDGGVGLGLAISRDLARGMGGDLIVESALGLGSTFTVRLPRAAPPGTAGDRGTTG